MLSDLKKLLRHSSIYSIGNLLSKAIGFFLIPLYTHYLTPADYGVLELLELSSSIISLFFGLKIGSAVIRIYYDYSEERDKHEVVSTALLGVFFVGILIFLISVLMSSKLSNLVFSNILYEKHFKIVLFSTALSLVASVPEAYLMARQKSLFYTAVTLGTLTSYLIFNIWFIVFLKWGILGILYSSLITKICNTSFLCIYTIINNNIKFNFKKCIQMLRYGLPLVPAACGMFILNYVDRFFLQKITSSSTVGIYALGYKFGFMLSFLVIVPIQMILHPQSFEISKRPEGKITLEKMFTYIFTIIILPALCIALFAEEAIKIMATPSFYSAYKIVPYVVLGYVFLGLSNFFQLGMLIEKRTHLIGFAVLFASITNIIFNLILIPKFGIMGAAYATSASFCIMFIIFFYLCQKRYPLKIESNRVLKIIVVSLSIYFLSNFISLHSIIYSISLKACLILSFPFFLYCLRFFTKEEKDKISSVISKIKLKPLRFRKLKT